MNFYFEAAKVLDRLDAKQGSIKGVIATVPEKDRKRTAALVIETLKCERRRFRHARASQLRHTVVRPTDKDVLGEIMEATNILKQERKITSRNLGLVLVHDLLLAGGIQASEGVVKQAVLRHKSRLHSELQRIKIKRGVKSTGDLARTGDERAGERAPEPFSDSEWQGLTRPASSADTAVHSSKHYTVDRRGRHSGLC